MTNGIVSLTRFAYTPLGVFGKLTYEGFTCYTVERPWKGNKQSVSCVPEGSYPLAERSSPKVSEVTGGRHPTGWEIRDVKDRSHIMIHPANTMFELEGCIGVGDGLACIATAASKKVTWAVSNSQSTFDVLMNVFRETPPSRVVIGKDMTRGMLWA